MARFTKAARKAIVDEFVSRHGVWDAAKFVEEVRANAGHPAHDWFEWNDGKAAEEHRIWQARQFVRDLTVVYEVEEVRSSGPMTIRCEMPAVHSPMQTRRTGGGYVPTNPQQPDALLSEAERSLAHWLKRYEGACKMAGVETKPIQSVLQRLERAHIKAADAA